MVIATPVASMLIEEAHRKQPAWIGTARDFYAIFRSLPMQEALRHTAQIAASEAEFDLA